MIQLIPIALFALAGFSSVANAAPTGINEVSPMVEYMSDGSMNIIPTNWKRNDHDENSGDFIDASKAMLDQNMMMIKRQSVAAAEAPIINLEELFRPVFDNLINYFIENTPLLKEIFDRNYDSLYKIFLEKIHKIVLNIGSDIENVLTEGKPFDLFGNSSLTSPPPSPGKEISAPSEVNDDEEDNEDDDDDDDDDDGDDDDDDEDEEKYHHKKWDGHNDDDEE